MEEKQLIQRPSKEELFTDRQEFLGAFEGALTGLTPDAPKVLVFHGPPGIGKTAIREELIRRLKDEEYPGADAWGLFQFDAETRNAPDVALAILSGQLNASGGVRFPTFEIGSAVYWRKKSPYLELNQKNFVGFKVGSLAFKIAGIFVPGVSLGAIVTGALDSFGGKAKKSLKKWWHARGNDDLRGIEYLEHEEILEKLPRFFGTDLGSHLNGKKAVIFLDGYESVWLSESRTRYSDDAWVRSLIENCPGALFVLGTRRPVKWDEIDGPEGKYWAPVVEQIEVPDFMEAYTRELLAKAKITDEGIVKAVAEGSEGVPLYIDLCIDIYYAELDKGNTPGPDGFPSTHQKIFERFIRDIDEDERAALEVVSCARFFDRDIFKTLIKEFGIAYSATNFTKFVGFSFIRGGEVTGTYRIHDLLSKHLQKYMDCELKVKVHSFLFEHYRIMADVDDPKVITEGNVRALGEAVHHGLGTGDVEGAVKWFNIDYQPYESAALYGELEPLYVELIEEAELVLGGDNASFAAALGNLAALYEDRGRYDEAEPLYLRDLEITEKALGPYHPSVAVTLNNLAGLYESQGRYDEAELLYLRSLEIREKVLGPEHPDLGTTLNNLAVLYRAEGRYDEAEPLCLQAIGIYEKAFGLDHLWVATPLNNLAALYEAQGRYDEAEPLYIRSLEITEKALGPNHPDLATTINNLAELYKAQGRFPKAEPLYVRSLGILERVLGPEHPYVAQSLNNLAELYRAQGRYPEAEPLYDRSLGMLERVLGPEHPYVAQSLNNLGLLYKAQGRYGEAEPLYERILGIFERALDPDHPSVATALNSLGGLYEAQGRYGEAEALYLRSLDMREKVLGPGHPALATMFNNLGLLFNKTDRKNEAIECLEQAFKILTGVLPPNHPNIIKVLMSLSGIYSEIGEKEKAAEYARRAEELKRSREEGEEKPPE